jgi:hypothetical protein
MRVKTKNQPFKRKVSLFKQELNKLIDFSLGFFIVCCSVAIFIINIKLPTVQAQDFKSEVIVSDVKPNLNPLVQQTSSFQVVLTNEMPIDLGERREAIYNQFRAKGYSEVDIQKIAKILHNETMDTLNPELEPYTWVKHCKGSNGWYAVELKNYGGYWDQAYCNEGDVEGRNEKSTGLFQILWSTWDNTGCEGDKYNWIDQINCLDKMVKKDGWAHWYYLVD